MALFMTSNEQGSAKSGFLHITEWVLAQQEIFVCGNTKSADDTGIMTHDVL